MSDYCRRCQQHFSYCGCTEIERLSDRIEGLEAQRDRYKARAERAEETLRFYADENRFGLPSEGPWGVGSVDFGKKARATLAQIGVKPVYTEED